MFEKEAEEYVKAFTDRSHIWSNDKLMQLQLREAYKDGAELGCKKANEWHYVKDGKYPTHEKDVEVLYKGLAAGCHFVNVTKGHICPCEFDNFESAIEDLNKQTKEGRVVSYTRLPDMLSEPLENEEAENELLENKK